MQLLHFSHASRLGVQLYLLLLFLRVLLSWFPAFNWERQPWLTLRQARPALCRLQTPVMAMRPVHSLHFCFDSDYVYVRQGRGTPEHRQAAC